MHLVRNHKLLGSGGSMVARLKLKGIDGGFEFPAGPLATKDKGCARCGT